jgi:hypothetical protein
MLLFYIAQGITVTKLVYCLKIITIGRHRFRILHEVALLSFQPLKFVLPQCCYCRLYEFGIVSNGITTIPSFIKIRPAILELKHADGRIDIHDQQKEFISCKSPKERITKGLTVSLQR